MKTGFLALSLIIFMHTNTPKIELINLNSLYNRVDHGQDTVYIINFWATWCGPCAKELPDFEKLSVDYKSEKLKVLLISLDGKSKIQTSVLPFIKRNGIKNEVFILDESDPQVYINRVDSNWSGGLPATLIIKNGKRKFFENDFTYEELLNEYKKFK
jgi:thiol-disulfide isomerase/thioredoxin